MTTNPLRCLKQQLETYLHIAHTWQRILSPSQQELLKTKVMEYKTLLVLVNKALEKYEADDTPPSPAHPTFTSNHKKHRAAY